MIIYKISKFKQCNKNHMRILKGYIKDSLENGKYFSIEVSRRSLIKAKAFYPYGSVSNIKTDGSSLALIIYPDFNNNEPVAIPFNVPLEPTELAAGEKAVGNFNAGNSILFKEDGSIQVTSSNDTSILDNVNIVGDLNISGVYKVGDTQVITSQQPAIPDATGGAVIDSEARAALNLVLAALRTHGLISI